MPYSRVVPNDLYYLDSWGGILFFIMIYNAFATSSSMGEAMVHVRPKLGQSFFFYNLWIHLWLMPTFAVNFKSWH